MIPTTSSVFGHCRPSKFWGRDFPVRPPLQFFRHFRRWYSLTDSLSSVTVWNRVVFSRLHRLPLYVGVEKGKEGRLKNGHGRGPNCILFRSTILSNPQNCLVRSLQRTTCLFSPTLFKIDTLRFGFYTGILGIFYGVKKCTSGPGS